MILKYYTVYRNQASHSIQVTEQVSSSPPLYSIHFCKTITRNIDKTCIFDDRQIQPRFIYFFIFFLRTKNLDWPPGLTPTPSHQIPYNNWVALRERVPNVLSCCHTKKGTGADFLDFFFFWNFFLFFSEKSLSYQKKAGRGHAHPSFLWYDNDSDH